MIFDMVKLVCNCIPILLVCSWHVFSLSGNPRPLQESTGRSANELTVGSILQKTSEYCLRLENAALDFVCLEEVREKIDLSRDIVQTMSSPQNRSYSSGRFVIPDRWVENEYLFDYQFIRRRGKIKEQRTLLKENGRPKREPNAQPKTQVFHFENVLFGPIWLLKKEYQKHYEYKIVDKEAVNGQDTIVLLAESRAPFRTRIHSGKIWLRARDLGVLKIEWKPESIGNYETIERRAESYGADPQIISISEYAFEKNGIYFPSRDYTEEAYITKKGKKFVRSKTTIVYSDYKFFTVESEVIY
jgi:hypothetical protein